MFRPDEALLKLECRAILRLGSGIVALGKTRLGPGEPLGGIDLPNPQGQSPGHAEDDENESHGGQATERGRAAAGVSGLLAHGGDDVR